MKKKNIFFIANELPKHLYYSNEHEILRINDSYKSLMDADILIIDPSSFNCYVNRNELSVDRYFQDKLISQIDEHLEQNKNIFILFRKHLKSKDGYNSCSNYHFISQKFYFSDNIENSEGSIIKECKDSIFKEFFHQFGNCFSYDAYIKSDNLNNCKTIFTGKHQENILGFRFESGNGNVIFLPLITNIQSLVHSLVKNKNLDQLNEEEILKIRHNTFDEVSSRFYQEIVKIDKALSSQKKKSPPPAWINDSKYSLKREKEILEKVDENEKKITVIKNKIDELEKEKNDLIILKDLLFETGANLEIAVNKALKIIGYEVVAENHIDDKDTEYDQILKSPEGIYYVGECEGKETKAINFEKSSKMASKKNLFIEEMTKKGNLSDCYGILFGNPFREILPENRTNDFFTSHCLVNAKSSNIILIKTLDLFYIAKYLCENNDEQFKKECRDKILNSLGKVVEFPNIPIVS